MIVADGLSHRRPHQEVDREPMPDPVSNLGCGDRHGKALQGFAVKTFRKGRFWLAGTRDHQEFQQARKVRRRTPFWQKWHVIRPDDIVQFGPREQARVMTDRIDRVRNAASFEFQNVNRAPGQSSQSEPQHLRPKMPRGNFLLRFKWRLRGRDKNDAIQSRFFPRRLGDQHVSEVDGVERPAIKANAHFVYLKYSWMVRTE